MFTGLGCFSPHSTPRYNKKKLLSGILYLHPITNDLVAGAPQKNLRNVHKVCGKDAMSKLYLTTTMWDKVDPHEGEKRMDDLRAGYWKSFINQGAQIARCGSDDGSMKQLLRQILARETPRKASQIQDEVAEQKMELKQTTTEQQLYSLLEALVEKQMDLLRRIDKERNVDAKAEVLEELQAEYSGLRAQIDDRLRQMEEPKLPLLKRFWTRISKVR